MPLSFGQVLKGALLAGLLAAIVVAAFQFVATEPLMEQAINLETQRHLADGSYEPPLLSRDAQRAGLFIGFLIYGGSWALLFAAVFTIGQRWLPGSSAAARGAWLAALCFWALALLPALRYPANPPGVGDPDTINTRQALFLAVLAIGIVGSIVTLALNQVLIRRGATPRRRLLVGGGMIVVCTALVLIAMPPTVDMVGTPADLIMRFRAFSLGGLALFWLVLGSGFALFVRRAQAAASLAPPRSSVSVSRS